MLSDDQFIAASIGDIDWLQQSISRGTVKYDKNGLTALHLAATHGHLDCMMLLVEEYGFNVDLKAQNGCTPLQVAISKESDKSSLACVNYLLDKGANPSLHDDEGITALHRAASQGRLAILQRLLDCGAKVDHRDKNGHLPLDLARMWGHERCGKILKATMWHKDKEYIAIQMKRLQLIKHQLSKRVIINESHKERKGGTRTKQITTNNDVLDTTKFKSRIKISTIQTDKILKTGKEVKKKHPKSSSKTKQMWKPFSKDRPTGYVPNLKDEYPKDPYTSKHKSKNETKYFHGKHKHSPVYLEALLTTDDQFSKFHLPDLPSDIIAKELASDLSQFERPVVFKCKNILDVPAKWKPSDLPKNEVCLHLSTDTSSIVFQNSLQPKTKVLIGQSRKKLPQVNVLS